MTRVGIIGATGYAGAELARILAGHKRVEVTLLTSRQYHGKRFSELYPAMTGIVDAVCEEYSEAAAEKADFFFTALPHKLPMATVPHLFETGKRVVDLSADFRFSDPAAYEEHYQPHTAKELLRESVYGLSEVYEDGIKSAAIVGNPGCYPTTVLLPLIPLLEEKIVNPRDLVADSKSGVSGAGRGLSLGSLFCEVGESFKAYKAAEHRHNPEMDEILSEAAGEKVHITFTPHLLPMSRGMETTIYANPVKKITAAEVLEIIGGRYAGRRFIRIRESGKFPDTRHVRGTNFCDMGAKLDEKNGRLIIFSAIDNLVKGAAGQAVQNMNIMLGFDETEGLDGVPHPL